MKRILLLLSLVTSMAYGQVSNTTATNFTNSLEASRIFNLPALVATPPVGIKPGGLSYSTVFQKLAVWNGTAWVYLLSETNADSNYIRNNMTNVPEAKRISVSDSIKTTKFVKATQIGADSVFFNVGNTGNRRYKISSGFNTTDYLSNKLFLYNSPSSTPNQYFPILQFRTGGGAIAWSGQYNDSPGFVVKDYNYLSKPYNAYYLGGRDGHGMLGFMNNGLDAYNFINTGRDALQWDSLGNVTQYQALAEFNANGNTHLKKQLIVDGNSLFGTTTDNGSNVQINRSTNDAIPAFYLNSQNPISGSDILSLNVAGVRVASVLSGGVFVGSGIRNLALSANSSVLTTANGTTINRNMADSNPDLQINSVNPGSTGDFLAMRNSTNVNVLRFDYRGIIGINNTLLTALQSYRVNAAGTSPEAFTPQSIISLTTTGTGAATFNQGTGALNIPTNSSGGSGTVTSVATTGNNGISGTVTNPNTTPSIALTADTSVIRTVSNSLTKAQTQTALNLKAGLAANTYTGSQTVNSNNIQQFIVTNNFIPVSSLGSSSFPPSPSRNLGKLSLNTALADGSASYANILLANPTITTANTNYMPPTGGTLANSTDLAQKANVTDLDFKQNVITLTTTGSGASTFDQVTGALNIPTPSLSGYEVTANKQNSLATDATNLKYPTVTAVNSALANYVTTNSSQTGLSGTKEWTGIHRFLNPILVGVSTGFNVTYSGTGTVVTTNGGTTSFTQNIPLKNGTYALVEDLPQYISVPSGTTAVSLIGNATYGFHAATLTTATLPSTNPAEGTLITLIGIGAGQFRISQNASQYIVSGNATTTVGTGGYIQTTTNNTTITIRYMDTNRWQVTSSNSAPTVN